MIIYSDVSVTDKEVKSGTETTLTCSISQLSVEVQITWWDGDTEIDNEGGKRTKLPSKSKIGSANQLANS